MTYRRSRIASGVSGGGFFFCGIADTASAGGSLFFDVTSLVESAGSPITAGVLF